MTATDYTLMNYLEQAHDALVSAAKIAHLEKHPEAEAVSKLIDQLEEIESGAWERFCLEAKQS